MYYHKKSWKNIITYFTIGALLIGVGIGIGKIYSMQSNSKQEVMAIMESDVSVQEKMIYLENRVSNEMSTMNILFGYSDLCSSKYVNELDTLRMSIKDTLDGYNKIKDEIISSNQISSKYKNYDKLYKEYEKLVKNITDEKYDEALKTLDLVNQYRLEKFIGVEKEITKLNGN